MNFIKTYDEFINEFLIHGKSSNKVLVFDVDDTLITSDAKVYVYNGDELVHKLDSQEFNHYKLQPNERFSFEEFEDLDIMLRSEIKPYFGTMMREYARGIHISILTARGKGDMIRNFFLKKGIDIHPDLIFATGDDKSNCSVAEKKAKCIKTLVDYGYKTLIFFDDNLDNLRQVKRMGEQLNVKVHIIKA